MKSLIYLKDVVTLQLDHDKCVQNCPAEVVRVQAGVGCAAAVINTALGRESSSCCCVIEQDETLEDSCSNPKNSGCC